MTDLPGKIGPWRRHSRRLAYENDWITVWHDVVTRPDGGAGIYGVVHYANLAAGAVVLDEEDRLLLVGQHRYTLDRHSWKSPRAGCRPGRHRWTASGASCSRRRASRRRTARARPRPSLQLVSDEEAVVFTARSAVIGEAQPEPTEDIEVRWVPFEEALAMTRDGRITDAMSVIGIQGLALERAGAGER